MERSAGGFTRLRPSGELVGRTAGRMVELITIPLQIGALSVVLNQ